MQLVDRPFIPSPLDMPVHNTCVDAVADDTKTAECLCCGTTTVHARGEASYDAAGALLVQWWKCTQCDQAETV